MEKEVKIALIVSMTVIVCLVIIYLIVKEALELEKKTLLTEFVRDEHGRIVQVLEKRV